MPTPAVAPDLSPTPAEVAAYRDCCPVDPSEVRAYPATAASWRWRADYLIGAALHPTEAAALAAGREYVDALHAAAAAAPLP